MKDSIFLKNVIFGDITNIIKKSTQGKKINTEMNSFFNNLEKYLGRNIPDYQKNFINGLIQKYLEEKKSSNLEETIQFLKNFYSIHQRALDDFYKGEEKETLELILNLIKEYFEKIKTKKNDSEKYKNSSYKDFLEETGLSDTEIVKEIYVKIDKIISDNEKNIQKEGILFIEKNKSYLIENITKEELNKHPVHTSSEEIVESQDNYRTISNTILEWFIKKIKEN